MVQLSQLKRKVEINRSYENLLLTSLLGKDDKTLYSSGLKPSLLRYSMRTDRGLEPRNLLAKVELGVRNLILAKVCPQLAAGSAGKVEAASD